MTTSTNPWEASSEGGSFERQVPQPIPSGAVIVGIILMGTVTESIKGKEVTRQKVRFNWEITTQNYIDTRDNTQRNFVIGQDYTLSFYPGSYLRELVQTFLGRTFPDDMKYDVRQLLGAKGILNMMMSPDGKYVNVSSFTQAMPGYEVPMNTIQPYLWDHYTNFSEEKLKEFGKIADRIRGSQEYKERQMAAMPPATSPVYAPQAQPAYGPPAQQQPAHIPPAQPVHQPSAQPAQPHVTTQPPMYAPPAGGMAPNPAAAVPTGQPITVPSAAPEGFRYDLNGQLQPISGDLPF